MGMLSARPSATSFLTRGQASRYRKLSTAQQLCPTVPADRSEMPPPKWITDNACANKELVRAFRELAADCTLMGKAIGSRTKAARPWNAKGKAYTKAANTLAALPDKISKDDIPPLEELEGLDEDPYAKVKLFLTTGNMMTDEEQEEFEYLAEAHGEQ